MGGWRDRTRHTARLAGAFALGYLVGTLPSANLATRASLGRDADIRKLGSGNPGAANARQVLGNKWAAGVLVADVGKGVLASMVGRRMAGPSGAQAGGTGAVIGHCYPAWTRFRGGKGVATSGGQCIATFPAYTPLDLAVIALTATSSRWKRRAFSATAMACICWVVAAIVWWRRDMPNAWGPEPTVALPLGAAVSSAVIVIRFMQS